VTAHSINPQLKARLVASFEQAYARYGQEFETAFIRLLDELEERHARRDFALWRNVVMQSQNPGEAVLQWHRMNFSQEGDWDGLAE
jgi:hypothetical protein